MFVVKLPLKITLGVNVKRDYMLNLNGYRNWKHFLKNNVKQEFHRIVLEQLPDVKMDKINITYVFYDKDNRRKDLSNVCSVIDKFFSDCLTEKGIITDDSCDYLPMITYKYAGKDDFKEGYVLAIVEEVSNA